MTRLRRVLLAAVAAVGAIVAGLGPVGAAEADPSATYQVANTGGLSLSVRSAPSLSASVTGTRPAGATIMIACQTTGDEVNGVSDIWDQLTSGGYVSDYYVDTPVVGAPSPGIPSCSSAAPPSAQPSPAEPSAAGLDGVNWPDARDNYQSGWLIPTGLSASDDYGAVYSKAHAILSQFKAAGANTVRLPINPATVLNSDGTGTGWWWSQYQGTIDAASALGMNVILSYWDHTNASGDQPGTIDTGSVTHPEDGSPTVTNLDCSNPTSYYASFNEMWDQVIGQYAGQSNIYFEIMNEPHGYPVSGWEQLATDWLNCHPTAPRDHVLVSAAVPQPGTTPCVGAQYDLADLAGDPDLDGTLLSLHYYNWCQGRNDAAGIENLLQPSYQGRVVVDEFGAPVTNDIGAPVRFGDQNSGDPNVRYLRQLTGFLHNSGMGAVYWPGLRGCDPNDPECDAYGVWGIDENNNLWLRGDGSILPLLQQAWN